VLADGIVLGSIGAACGVVLGIVLAFATRPLIEEHLAHSRAGGYRVFPLALVGIAVLAVATGLLAALVPAFVAARQPVVAALQGRRGVTRSRKRWLALGLGMIAAGSATAGYGAWSTTENIVLGGLVVGELGLVLCTPALVGLIARLGGRLPLAPRIALRDTARNRAAAAPAISAVMAAVAGSMALSVYLGSQTAQNDAGYQPSLPMGNAMVRLGDGPTASADAVAVTAAMRASLPTTDVVTVSGFSCADPPKTADGKALSCGFNVSAELPAARRCPYAELERQPTRDEERNVQRRRR
jgi:putative ABC transport system permease protein